MHIPDVMLGGAVCPVTAVVGAVGVAAAAVLGTKAKDKPTAARFGAVTALIFAGQMMNFPVMNGTSGHLLGGVLAASLLGTPFGVLALALVVTIQALVFADGGITVLGTNIVNMALVGAGLGGFLRSWLAARCPSATGKHLATAVAAWVSVVVAATAVSMQLAVDGQIPLATVLPAMLGVHVLIGLGESAITVAACLWLTESAKSAAPVRPVFAPLMAAGVVALVLSPFASGFPDGLEWVAERYHFLHESVPRFVSPMPDYAVSAVAHEGLSTGLAGLIGVILTFAIAWLAVMLVNRLPHFSR